MQSSQPLKEADPHDVFAIESILAARADRPPLAQDPAGQPAAGEVHIAPEISVGAAAPQVEPIFLASDIRDIPIESTRTDEIRVDDIKPPHDRPASKWMKRVVMALLGLCGATAAAAWQHYGDHAKAMAAGWAPPFVLAALSPSEKPPAAEPSSAPAVQTAATDQPAVTDHPAQPAQPEQATAPATPVPSDQARMQAMTQDLAAMGRQVEELKASIAQLRTSNAQLAREVAKGTEARAEVRPTESAPRPRVAAATPPRPAVAPARKPTAYPPAQAAYVQPLTPAPVQAQPAPPPPALADDGQPVVRPPMPVR